MVCAKAEKPPLNIVRSWCVWHAVRRDRRQPERRPRSTPGSRVFLRRVLPRNEQLSSRSWRVQIVFFSFVFWKIKNRGFQDAGGVQS